MLQLISYQVLSNYFISDYHIIKDIYHIHSSPLAPNISLCPKSGRTILHHSTAWEGQLCPQLSSFCMESFFMITEYLRHPPLKALHKITSHICSEAGWRQVRTVCSLLPLYHPGLSFWHLLENRDGVRPVVSLSSAPGRGSPSLQKQGVQQTTENKHGKREAHVSFPL